MKNLTLKLLTVSAFVVGGYTAHAQTAFSQTSAYDTIANTPETLTWYIVQPDSAAYGTASLTVYYEGDFGANSEYIEIYDENGGLLGATQPYFDGNDCMQDSVTITFPASLLAAWSVDDTIWFTGVTTGNVDYFCTTNHARVKLDYNFCTNGGPIASMSIPQTEFCSLDAPVTVTTTPAGGTLSGPGISGNTFSAAALAPGSYTINYTYTNAGGCTSDFEIVVEVLPGIFIASVTPDTICPWNTAVLTAEGTGHIVWYADAGLTTPLDSGNTFVTPQLMTTTSYYAATAIYDNYFMITSLTDADSVVVDHDAITGDDRGGIAVTMNYVYIVGDDSTVRYDLDLQNPTSYFRTDGLVSDLATGQLYTLYNPIAGMPDANVIDSMYITELRTLNADLTLGSGVITLSDSIPFGWDNNYNLQSGVFAGNGFVIIFSAPRMSWYVIDLQDGIVTNLGTSGDPMMNYSETWSAWGVAEFDGTGYSALYRDQNSSDIMRKSLPGGTPVAAYSFTDLSDMASFTYAPWNNRWYMHFEGGSQFNGSSETAVYATASDSTGPETGSSTINCPSMATVTVDICLGTEESAGAAMNVYPNPTEGVFTINMTGLSDATIEVIAVDGSLVYSEKTNGAQSVKEINLSGAAAGVYLVRVTDAANVVTTRLIKQ
jgi:hypothetical protein